MEQHPIPQHIASYEFRLVGDMTLKQFGYLAGGVVIAIIFYALPLPSYFKWPAIVFFSIFGAALAFVPIGERPLSLWIVAFFKAVFSPSQFIWQKKPVEAEIFKPCGSKIPISKTIIPPADRQQLREYLSTLPISTAKSPLEQQEENFLKEVTNLFQLVKMPVITPTLPEKPGRPKKPAVQASISTKLPIPAPPTRPNILVGMVLTKKGEIIEGAILEIRNSQGIPVRALRTNKLGQFMIATPLENDTYEIETEKEGYQFDIIKITVKGEIIQPIEIRAK